MIVLYLFLAFCYRIFVKDSVVHCDAVQARQEH